MDDFKFEDNYRRSSDRREFRERRATSNLEQELKNLKFQSDHLELPPFEKDFYTEHSITTNRPQVCVLFCNIVAVIWS